MPRPPTRLPACHAPPPPLCSASCCARRVVPRSCFFGRVPIDASIPICAGLLVVSCGCLWLLVVACGCYGYLWLLWLLWHDATCSGTSKPSRKTAFTTRASAPGVAYKPKVAESTTSAVRLTCCASADDGGSPINGFVVELAGGICATEHTFPKGKELQYQPVYTGPDAHQEITGLPAGKAYLCRVACYNMVGCGPFSQVLAWYYLHTAFGGGGKGGLLIGFFFSSILILIRFYPALLSSLPRELA